MFGKRKLRKDLPVIDLTKKPQKSLFGKIKHVPTSKREQRKLKQELMKTYPDRYYVDDLNANPLGLPPAVYKRDYQNMYHSSAA